MYKFVGPTVECTLSLHLQYNVIFPDNNVIDVVNLQDVYVVMRLWIFVVVENCSSRY